MAYQLRWQQHRDGSLHPQTHDFDDLDEAKEFAEGLGAEAHAEVFDSDADKVGDDKKPVWSADAPQATDKERDAARAAATVGKSEGLGPNTKPDTREDKPEDLRKEMGAKPSGPSPTATASPPDKPTAATPAGSRQLDADKGGQGQPGAGAASASRDGSVNRGVSQDGGGGGDPHKNQR